MIKIYKIYKYLLYPKEGLEIFVLINSDIQYNYKYLNREELDNLKKAHSDMDDIIIIKDRITYRYNHSKYTPYI